MLVLLEARSLRVALALNLCQYSEGAYPGYMVLRRHLFPPVSILAASLLGWAAPAAAQHLQGRVVDGSDGSPLAAAYVEVLLADRPVATALTDADGRFLVAPGAVATYTVRADHIGYAPSEAVVDLAAGTSARIDLRLDAQAVELDGLSATVDRRCRVGADDAVRVAALWSEVAEAFRAAALADDEGAYEFRFDRWDRTLEPTSLRIENERRSRRRAFQRESPFRSVSAEDLAAHGYVRGDAESGYDYFAPDLRTLSSRDFQDAHCFGIVRDAPRDGEEHWVGVQFFPQPTELTEVAGTLWIDGNDLGPERLDFTYTNLPWAIETENVGGQVAFERLEDGPWIVQAWHIRMPLVESRLFRAFNDAPLAERYDVVALSETGGQVTEVRATGRAATAFTATGRVTGTIRDDAGRPVEGARVVVVGTQSQRETDAAGRFDVATIPEGRYTLTYTSPLLDSLGLPARHADVDVEADQAAELELMLPAVADLVMEQCRDPLTERGRGVLRGRLPEEDVVPGARPPARAVRISWASTDDVSTAGGTLSVRQSTIVNEVPVAPDGRWLACGLPSDVPLEVQAVALTPGGTLEGATETARVRGRRIATLDLTPPNAETGTPVYELSPITVAVERARSALLNEVGVRTNELGRRFMSREDFEDDIPRAQDAVDLIRIRNIPNVRVARLGGGTPCVYSTRYTRPSGGGGPTQQCALVVIDGVPIPPESAGGRVAILSPDQIAAMAFLRASEAGARFGTGSAGGVLFIWTHQGR